MCVFSPYFTINSKNGEQDQKYIDDSQVIHV